MSTKLDTAEPSAAGAVLVAGVGLGLLADGLLRAPGEPGLNLFLWALALALTMLLLRRRRGGMSVEAVLLLAVGVLFAAGMVWRAAPPLKLLALAATAGAFALPALRAGAAWVRNSGVLGYGAAVAAAALHSGVGTLLALNDVDWNALRDQPGRRSRWRGTLVVARGAAIALPFLLVFGGLFMAADAVFAQMVADAARIDLETVASHVVLAGFFGWVATGYMRGFLVGTRLPELQRLAPRRPYLGIGEIATALGLLAALFAAFVAVQFRYLFGGAALVETTAGLTYAEYARRGFFELVVVSALMLPVLLAADWLLRRRTERDDRTFRLLAGTQIVLLVAVMASALQRLRLYQSAYGLTESRLYATALLLWLGAVLLWLAWTVLRGRRQSFAFGALVSAFAALLVLNVLNPDALIARTNLERLDLGARFDASYAASLSADAVPTLVAGLSTLPPEARCRIARRMLDRWSPEAPTDWRNWNRSVARARSAVQTHQSELRLAVAAAGPDGRCPADP